jgi:hypothetical protein
VFVHPVEGLFILISSWLDKGDELGCHEKLSHFILDDDRLVPVDISCLENRVDTSFDLCPTHSENEFEHLFSFCPRQIPLLIFIIVVKDSFNVLSPSLLHPFRTFLEPLHEPFENISKQHIRDPIERNDHKRQEIEAREVVQIVCW